MNFYFYQSVILQASIEVLTDYIDAWVDENGLLKKGNSLIGLIIAEKN